MQKLQQNQKEKVESAFWLSNQKLNKLSSIFLFFSLLFLPFQLGKHFWPSFAFVLGQRVDYLSPTIYLSDIGIFILIFLGILQNKFKLGRIGLLWLLGLILFLSLGIFVSQSPFSGWYYLVKLIEFFCFAWIIGQDKKPFLKLFWSFSIGVIIEGVLGIFQFIHLGSLNGMWYFLGERSFTSTTAGIANATINGQLFLRPYATFPHPNVFAGYLVISLLFFLATALYIQKKHYRIFAICLIAFGTGVLFLTLSRSAIVVWMVLGLWGILIGIKDKKLKSIVGSAGIFSFIIFLLIPVLSGRFLDGASYIESIDLRLLLQEASLKMIQAHMLLGVGFNNFLVSLPYYIQGHVLFGFLQPVHNIYLLVFAETGIFGLLGFLGILWLALKNSLSKWRVSPSFLTFFSSLSMLAIIVLGLTDHYFLTIQQGQLLLALVLGLCLHSATIRLWPFTKSLPHTPFTK